MFGCWLHVAWGDCEHDDPLPLDAARCASDKEGEMPSSAGYQTGMHGFKRRLIILARFSRGQEGWVETVRFHGALWTCPLRVKLEAPVDGGLGYVI